MTPSRADVPVVVLGASGDLATRRLIPNLVAAGADVVGVDTEAASSATRHVQADATRRGDVRQVVRQHPGSPVYIALPPRCHVSAVEAVIRSETRGPVYLEKGLSNPADLERIIRVSRGSSTRLHLVDHYLADPAI